MDCSHQCGGKCCTLFPLNFSPAKIYDQYTQAQDRIAKGLSFADDEDVVMIAEMIRRVDQEADEQPMYTCVHLTSEGLCGIYDRRPRMCRQYPYGRACDLCGYNPVEELIQLRKALADLADACDAVKSAA